METTNRVTEYRIQLTDRTYLDMPMMVQAEHMRFAFMTTAILYALLTLDLRPSEFTVELV